VKFDGPQLFRVRAARQALLDRITASLASDERFVAAWLAGSFGRGEADDFSDLDLSIVVADPFQERLCARPHMTGAGTVSERLSLFSRFGDPAVIHENHHNAPAGGAFTFVLYREQALIVDWTLIPRSAAARPVQSVLLFDRAGIPFLPAAAPASRPERAEMTSERAAFFWMIAAVVVKSLLRQDAVSYYALLGVLYDTLEETRRLVAGASRQYRRRPPVPQAHTIQAQKQALHRVCAEMETLMPSIIELGGSVPAAPMQPIDILLELAED
jgi:hypothetical protein